MAPEDPRPRAARIPRRRLDPVNVYRLELRPQTGDGAAIVESPDDDRAAAEILACSGQPWLLLISPTS